MILRAWEIVVLLALTAGVAWLVLLILRKRRVFRYGQTLFAPLVQEDYEDRSPVNLKLKLMKTFGRP